MNGAYVNRPMNRLRCLQTGVRDLFLRQRFLPRSYLGHTPTAIMNRNTKDIYTDLLLRVLYSLRNTVKIKFQKAA